MVNKTQLTDRDKKLKDILNRIWQLKESPLYKYRTENHYYPVIGEGSHEARIMFIGEAPGENEARTGRPFCGAAGRLLDQLLESINLQRADVYISNIVKDRPPNNRDPSPEEIELYSPFLDEQINIIQPKIIATLGRFSMQYVLEKFNLPESGQTISKLHGRVLKTKTVYGKIMVFPLYHPAAALYTGSLKETLMKDMQKLTNVLSE